jgi:alpha,alpha-trehalase
LIENQPPAVAKRISRDVASAAESGHDFGSRWLADAGTNEVPPGTTSDGDVAVDVASLRSIRTTRVVPADLNGFMLKTACDISATASAVGDGDAAARFEREAARIRSAIAEVLWDGETGRWRDLLLRDWDGCIGDSGDFSEDEAIRDDSGYVPGVRASDWIPLWCGAVDAGSQDAIDAVDALRTSGLVLPGGIATSLAHTGHQWDYPNAWAPLVHSICDGCERYGGVKGAAVARDVAVRWVRGCASLMERTGYMHEKYDARVAGTRAGGGGEYTPQRGFGWSNGVALYFLWKYLAGPSRSDGEVHHSESTHSLPDGVMRP